MKRLSWPALILLLALCIPTFVFSGSGFDSADILVRFKEQVPFNLQRGLAASLGYREVHHVKRFNISRWRFQEAPRSLLLKIH
jgi:hypothetical protein